MSKFSKIITITMLALFVCLQAGYSQVTTSSMSGSVSEKGETLIGATIVATHEPTGTVYGTVTNTNGRYAIQGMRTGGPYKVVIQYIGYNSHTQDNVFLQLGETYVLDALLSESTTALGEVVISAERTKFTTEKTGATTNVNNEQMQKLPTINRSIQDITRLSPYANGMSFAGSDGRSSNLTIDGANLNNNFGLSSALPGGGNPISLDAIEEVQVVIAPFDVRQTNFIGGGVNAITKSGTNTFKGSAYVYYRNQDMRGGKIGDYDFEKESGKPRAKESRTVYGATFGGPIIKNKLFFFGNIEYEKSPQQVITYRASTDGTAVAGAISRTKESDLQAVSDHLKNKYGYNTGSYKDFPADATNLKYLLRLDWNINDANKFNIRYNYTKNTAWNPPNGNSADAGYRFTFNRVSEMSMSYANSMYSMDNLVNSATAELNSRFNANMSNQLLATYSLIKDVRGSTSDPFPFIDIMNGYDASTGIQNLTPYIAAGYELFTWNNGVTNKVATVTDNFTYYLNSHKFTAGISYEYQYADNNYMRNGTGYYRYASLEDFLNSAAPTDFALTFGNNGNTNPSNAVAFGQLGVYVQDEWNILNNLKITAGVRGDNLMFLNDIMRNNAIYNLDFGGRKIDTGTWPKSRINWSPRLGFTYDALKDKSLVIRGGIGIFTGRLPLVFFTNMPSNAGMIQQLQTIRTTYRPDGTVNVRDPRLDLLAGDIITDVNEMINRLGFNTTVTPESGTIPSEIAAVDPDFKMPQVWKSSLAVDYQIPVSF
ncbi:MAG: TonB-dependent receptor, partial [Tannerella sp.]|nr:TonB-dependent receptor [Tannerella sp.]